MHTAAGLLLFAMLFGIDEPEPEPGAPPACEARAACDRQSSARQTAARRAGFGAELRGGKLLVSHTTVDRGRERVQRVILRELTDRSYAWEWERSDDGGRTWVTLYETAYSLGDRAA